MPDTPLLVILAKRLECRYPGDPCELHDGFDRRHRAEDGFETCTPCKVRREAELVDAATPRARKPRDA
jgi:hypothetical protein